MSTHREKRSRQAVAVTAMALAMGFLSVADAYAQSRRGSGFAAQSQTRRPFTVTSKAPRIDVPKAPRVQPGRQELVASKAPRAGTPVQQTVPLPVKRSAKPKVVKKAVKHTTVRKKRPHRKYGYRYHDHHHGYDGPMGTAALIGPTRTVRTMAVTAVTVADTHIAASRDVMDDRSRPGRSPGRPKEGVPACWHVGHRTVERTTRRRVRFGEIGVRPRSSYLSRRHSGHQWAFVGMTAKGGMPGPFTSR